MNNILLLIFIFICIISLVPSNKICNKIDAIVYINLINRLDRKKQISKELDGLKCKYKRIDAIKHKNGGLGCVRSHIKCLEYAKENKLDNILIFEDDFVFNESPKIIQKKIYNDSN